jgi:hypothetical protein
MYINVKFIIGRAIAEAVSRWLPIAEARVRARVCQVGFVLDKMALGQVFSEYFGFPCQPHFIPPTSPSSQSPRTGTRGQYMAAVPRGPSMDSTSHNSNKKIISSPSTVKCILLSRANENNQPVIFVIKTMKNQIANHNCSIVGQKGV